MLTRVVPAKEITAKKGLNARSYVPVRPKLKWAKCPVDTALYLAIAGGYRLTVYSRSVHTKSLNGWDWMVEVPSLTGRPVELTGFSDSKAWACLHAEAAVVKHARKEFQELMKVMGAVRQTKR